MAEQSPGVLPFGGPFPGLRPFQIEDSRRFFGREAQVDELLDRLANHRFVAVVGESGCGKSSLVQAGLIPALHRGYLRESTSRWRFAVMRPGKAPLKALASALHEASIGNPETLATLSASSVGLVDVVAKAGLDAGESLLVIVDQFEELFRYASGADQKDEAQARLFVRLLIDAVEQWAAPVYVVLTMRSDFLGQCAKFTGLPDMLNRSQYLVPRLGREQREDAIVRPLRLVGATPEAALVQELLNASSQDSTALPVLQHALARTYEGWRKAGDSPRVVRLEDYEGVGGINHALERHGDQLLAVTGELRSMCERLFKALTVTANGAVTRRPTSFANLQAILGASDDTRRKQLTALIRLFSQRKHSFLTLSPAGRVAQDTIVDITHESLIWYWPTLAGWVKEEARSSEWYTELARDVTRQQAGDVGFWRDPQLSRVLDARRQNAWSSEWARQYVATASPTFEETTRFLDEAVAEQDAERLAEEQREKEARQQERRIRQLAWTLAGVTIVFLMGVGVYLFLANRGLANTEQANGAVTQAASVQLAAIRDRDVLAEQLKSAREALALAQRPGAPASDAAAKAIEALKQQEAQAVRQQAAAEAALNAARQAAAEAVAANTAASQGQKDLVQQIALLQADRQRLSQQSQDAGVALSAAQNLQMAYQRTLTDQAQELETKKKDVERLTTENAELKRRLEELMPGGSVSDTQAIRAVLVAYFLGFPTKNDPSTGRLAAVFPDFAKYDGPLINTLPGVDVLTLSQTGDPTITLTSNNTRATADVMTIISTRLRNESNTNMESRQAHFEFERRNVRWVIVSKATR